MCNSAVPSGVTVEVETRLSALEFFMRRAEEAEKRFGFKRMINIFKYHSFFIAWMRIFLQTDFVHKPEI